MRVVRLKRLSAFVLALACALFVAGCGSSYDSPSSPNPPSAGVPFSQTDLRVGTGAEAVAGRRVFVYYTGWLYDANAGGNKGRQFDSVTSGSPYNFPLGAGQVIRGWDMGVPGMRVGGQRRLIVPPELAYGAAGAGNGAIPPNATLIFEVELLEVS